jgi:ribosome recycling factor
MVTQNVENIMADVRSRMDKSLELLKREIGSIRTDRANPILVENLTVDYYGVPTLLNQIASISIPEARLITIQPWDKQVLSDIEKSILKSDLNLTPNNDGTTIRIIIPPLNAERRKEVVRMVRKKAEDGRIAIRNVRRDGLEKFRAMEKNKELSQDARETSQEQLQKHTDSYITKVNELLQQKETEIIQV